MVAMHHCDYALGLPGTGDHVGGVSPQTGGGVCPQTVGGLNRILARILAW
jgi:hypothetical protein